MVNQYMLWHQLILYGTLTVGHYALVTYHVSLCAPYKYHMCAFTSQI